MSETTTSGSGRANPVVVFDGVRYDAIAGPGDATPLVRLVHATAMQSIDIDELVSHLNRIDDLLYIAACGVAGLIDPTTNQAPGTRIMGLHYKLRTRTGAMASTLLSIGEGARNMLAVLKGVFKDLYGLYEADAITRLARCGPLTSTMVESTALLETNFQSLIAEAGEILKFTSRALEAERRDLRSLQQRQLDIDARSEQIGQARAALELQMGKVRALGGKVNAARIRSDESESLQAFVSHIAMAFGAAIPLSDSPVQKRPHEVGVELWAALEEFETPTSGVRQQIEDAKIALSDIEAAYASEKSTYLDMLADSTKQEREALAAMAEDASSLEASADQEEIGKSAVLALQYVVATLRQVAALLAEQGRLWRKVTMDCAQLLQVDLRADIEDCMRRSPEERMEAYSASGFKIRLLAEAARWQALGMIADTYRSAIMAAYARMGETYAKSPSIEEARRLAPSLGAELAQKIATDIALLGGRGATDGG